MSDRNSFESSYRHYPFAELVRLSLVLAGFVGRLREPKPAHKSAHGPGQPARA